MTKIYQHIVSSTNNRQLAVLLDPEKEDLGSLESRIKTINCSSATHIFVGGSTDPDLKTDALVRAVKEYTSLPVVIFPGDINQISASADAILFLSLISGRNPEYLIDKQVQSVPQILESGLEVIPTGYLLIESGTETAVERVSKTAPLPRTDIQRIATTAKAGELLGMKLIYLEAGSGAASPIPVEIIKTVKDLLDVPLIVGGGIRTADQLDAAYKAGADLVVVGTAFEEDRTFFDKQSQPEIILNK